MTAEAVSLIRDVTDLINTLGEPLSFSRGTKKLVTQKGTFDKIFERNIDAGSASPMASEARTITIAATRYVPELFDVVQDSHKHLFQVQDITSMRFENSIIAYTLTIT